METQEIPERAHRVTGDALISVGARNLIGGATDTEFVDARVEVQPEAGYFDRCTFTRSSFIDRTLKGFVFTQCHFYDVELEGMVFDSCFFDVARFNGGDLRSAVFHGDTKILNSKFTGVDLSQTRHLKGVYNNVEFRNCRFVRSEFYKTRFNGVDFRDTDLRESLLYRVPFLNWCLLYGSNVEGMLALPKGANRKELVYAARLALGVPAILNSTDPMNEEIVDKLRSKP